MIEYGERARALPAPPHVVWDDLRPDVIESERPTLVVWSSLWRDRPGDRVVMRLGTKGAETLLHFTLLADGAPPDAEQTRHIRYRINKLLWADLRDSYDN